MELLQLLLIRLLPKKSLSRLVGRLSRSKWSRFGIKYFANHYKIDISQAELDFTDYTSLTDFFVRRLKCGLRPIAPAAETIVSPVDGVVSESGVIQSGQLIQAKGVGYSVQELLGNDSNMAKTFDDGLFITIYLSPKDYHRIHLPLQAKVSGACYIPGTLFPVNPFGVRAVKGLFARNERLITYLSSMAGSVALVKVGATIVGSIKVNYADIMTNLPRAKAAHWQFKDGNIMAKGDEIGRFEFGSTVILLFEKDKIDLTIRPGDRVLMGQAIGSIRT